MKKRKGNGLKAVLAVLIVLLAIVGAVIAYKQYEYGVSSDYYDSLRRSLRGVMRC